MNLAEILSSIQSSLAHAIEVSNAAITIGFLPTIQGDRTGLTQLFLNLLTNAIKFCGDTPPKIDVTALRHNNTWYLMVMDNGIGIDPAFHELIF